MPSLPPSRTYAIARLALLVELWLAVIGAIAASAASVSRADFSGLLELLATVAMCVAGIAGAGAGSMAARDSFSKGLTSSQGATVLEAQKATPTPTPTPTPADGGAP